MMRRCETCPHTLAEHADYEEGYTRPCLVTNCSCATFNDQQQRDAAAAIVGKPVRGPAGFVH